MLMTLILGGALAVASAYFIRRGLASRKRNDQEKEETDV